MPLSGQLIVGSDRSSKSTTFRATDPSTGASLEPPFAVATPADVAMACALAD